MIGMKISQAKGLFFDRAKVAGDKGTLRVLSDTRAAIETLVAE